MRYIIKQTGLRLIRETKKVLVVPEYIFLIFAVSFGTLFLFLIPPMQVPDEQVHMYKSYQTSDGLLWPTAKVVNGEERYGSEIPKNLVSFEQDFRNPVAGNPEATMNTDLYEKYLKTPLHRRDTKFITNEAANTYSFILYIPQAIGISTAKIFDASPLLLVWLGRLGNLIFWISIMMLCLRLLPFAKWAFVVLALNPVTLMLAVSLSGDVSSIAYAYLFTTLVFVLISTTDSRRQRKIALLLLAVSSLVALSKPTSLALLPLMLLAPYTVLNRGKIKAYSIGIVTTGAVIGLGVLWNLLISHMARIAAHIQMPGADPSGQLRAILVDPAYALEVVIKNYITVDPGTYGDAVLSSYMGVFGWLDTYLPLWVQILYIIVLGMAILYQFGRGPVYRISYKLSFLFVYLVILAGSILAMYLNFSPVGSGRIGGVQGRYFIPGSAVLLGIFNSSRKLITNYSKEYLTTIVMGTAAVLCFAAVEIARRYY